MDEIDRSIAAHPARGTIRPPRLRIASRYCTACGRPLARADACPACEVRDLLKGHASGRRIG